jgi:adenylate cyclase class 2
MPLEIEAKFRLADPDALRRALRQAGAKALGQVLEHNLYFDTPDGRLRRADCGLRLRTEQAAGAPARTVVTYKGPRRPGELKIRPEHEVAVDSAETARAILEGLALAPTLAFEKRREDFQLGPARVSLDELPELGFFLEIEADDEGSVQAARETLDLADEPTVTQTYIALVAEHLPAGQRELTFA